MFIKLGPIAYAVEFISNLTSKDGKDLAGEIDYDLHVIRVESLSSFERKQLILWHETMHGIADLYGIDLSEQDVATLSTVTMQAIRDNPILIKKEEECK